MELKRQGKKKKGEKKKKPRSWLNSKVESVLEVENPGKPFVGSSNSIVASWANVKLFSLASQIFHYQVPTFIPNILTKLSEPSAPTIVID